MLFKKSRRTRDENSETIVAPGPLQRIHPHVLGFKFEPAGLLDGIVLLPFKSHLLSESKFYITENSKNIYV